MGASSRDQPQGGTEAPAALLAARRVSKSYGAVRALRDVSVEIRPGEVHAIVGENGAGKSTLMRLLAGEERPDDGQILIDGRVVALRTPKEARAHGIAIVHQQFQLVDTLTVAENMALGAPPATLILGIPAVLDLARMRLQAEEWLAPFALAHCAMRLVRELTVAERQTVEIARALAQQSRLLILDEPTSALSAHETEKLFAHVNKLRGDGVAVVLIAHNLDEVLTMADRVTVLRDGRRIGTHQAGSLGVRELAHLIVGRALAEGYPKVAPQLGQPVLQAAFPADPGQRLSVRQGEIVGIPTFIGSAVRDILARLSGELTGAPHAISAYGRPYGAAGIGRRIKAGICLVPGDATADSLFPKMSIAENILVPNLGKISRLGVLDHAKGRELVDGLIRLLDIRPADAAAPVENLSGGNRQKVAIAKWLLSGARVLVMDDPTRGVDVGAKAEIYKVIGRLVREGGAVVLASSDLDELIGLADRILVLRAGRQTGTFETRPFDKPSLLTAISAVSETAAGSLPAARADPS